MKQGFLKSAITLIALAIAGVVSAAPNSDNTTSTTANTANNTKSVLQNQAANTQNATNSLIRWLNANFVTGTPPEFVQSMKGNWQTILANHNLNDLNWLLTQKFTLALLSGTDISNLDSNDDENDEVEVDSVPTAAMKASEIKSKVARFNIGSLLSTTTITPKSAAAQNAQALLQFVSGLNSAVTALPPQAAVKGMGPINEFQGQFGTYLAQQSVGLNALYSLLNERFVKKGLGEQLGGPEKDMSPLGLDRYMATRRLDVNDPKGWLAQLSNATPAQMDKEQLILLAEIRYEQYLTRRSLEQITTLLAVQQLQLSSADAVKLQQLKSQVMSASTSTILK